ncbi:MAG: hypothetical protein ABFD46_06545 [Armatimonadota bacterium]
MRCLTLFFLVAVLGLTCYNSWQIRRINLELTAVEKQANIDVESVERDLDYQTALKLAEDCTDRARKLIKKGQTDAARLELDKGLRKLETAARLSQGFASGAAHRAGSSWHTAYEQVEKAMDELSSQTKNGRPEGNETASGEHSNIAGHNGSKRAARRVPAGKAGIDK